MRAAATAQELRMLHDRMQAKLRRIAVAIIAGLVAGVAATIALVWLDIALYLYCKSQFGPPIASLIAAGALVVVMLLALIPLLLTRSPRRPSPRPPAAEEPAVAALRGLEELAKRNPAAIIIAAALAGLVLGSRRT